VIVERGKIFARMPTPKNVIIDHEIPNINVERHVYNEGTHRADPSRYRSLDGSTNADLDRGILRIDRHIPERGLIKLNEIEE